MHLPRPTLNHNKHYIDHLGRSIKACARSSERYHRPIPPHLTGGSCAGQVGQVGNDMGEAAMSGGDRDGKNIRALHTCMVQILVHPNTCH